METLIVRRSNHATPYLVGGTASICKAVAPFRLFLLLTFRLIERPHILNSLQILLKEAFYYYANAKYAQLSCSCLQFLLYLSRSGRI